MPEVLNDKKIFSLVEVTTSIHRTLAERYTSAFWVKAEMNKLNHYKHSGHCYPDLVEKANGKIIAQIRSTLWNDEFALINKKFVSVLNEPLKDGIKILFLAKINFDHTHGLSLRILDIDPSYTLGDLERERQESIMKLHGEGIFNQNKSLPLALLPQRLAIISVETSKGYIDFLKVIESNIWGYKFFHLLFPSLLQGDSAITDIIKQLKRIRKVKLHFDAVAIIRGGGGEIGLSCYNNYQLAKAIATFPIPVFTGVGHATNETVAEMVAHYNAITPTKLAEFLLQKFHNFSVPVKQAEEKIADKALRIISEQKNYFQSITKLFRSVTGNLTNRNHSKIQSFENSLSRQTKFLLKQKHITLEHLEKNVFNMSPQNVLKRGYSITRQNGKAVKAASELKSGDLLNTEVADGNIKSIVQ